MSEQDDTFPGQEVEVTHHEIETPKCGKVHVYVQGDLNNIEKKAIFLTVHDIGSNHTTFLDFAEHPCMSEIKPRSVFIHVDVPGQHDNADDLPSDFQFPTIQQMGEDLATVLDYLKVKLVVGFGDGAGANILVRFALAHPSRVLGLVLIHCVSTGVGMMEYFKDKFMNWKLSNQGMNPSAEQYLVMHKFGAQLENVENKETLIQDYTEKLKNKINPRNLRRFVESYMNRKDITSAIENNLNMAKKVVITGASGLLGRALVSKFEKDGWNTIGLAFSRANNNQIKLDLNEFERVRDTLHSLKPDVIVHSAAERFPDKVEKDLAGSRRLNVTCSENLAKIAGDLGTSFIYISTDYVFDGRKPPYSETDEPSPINQYGLSKLDGEKAVFKVNPDACVLRIPVLYGDEEYIGESAVSSLIKILLKKEPSHVSNFEIRYPSHVKDIAEVCAQLAAKKLQDPSIKSVYHWCGEEPLTKYEMSKTIAAVFNLEASHILPDNVPSSGAPRPHNTHLNCERLKVLGIGHHTPFDVGVQQSFAKFFHK